MSYDPIQDEKKLFTLDEMEQELKDAFAVYREALNDEAKQESRTWDEWMTSFRSFMSW